MCERESWIGGKCLELMPKITKFAKSLSLSIPSILNFGPDSFIPIIIKPPFELANAQQSFVNSIVEVDLI